MPKCCAHTKLYTYGEHPSSRSSSKMLWRRNPRCGTLRGHRLSCEHPSTTLSCIMMNPRSGSAFFCCGGAWDVNRAAKCVYSKFRLSIIEREAHGCKRRGSAACVARRFSLSSQFAKDGRQTKTSIELLMYHYGEHPSAFRYVHILAVLFLFRSSLCIPVRHPFSSAGKQANIKLKLKI